MTGIPAAMFRNYQHKLNDYVDKEEQWSGYDGSVCVMVYTWVQHSQIWVFGSRCKSSQQELALIWVNSA
ncbi:hypothetical protein HanOQP8_Chr04g0142441 [Helianthus annuus]|nr:hypothetical protein HanOQP8_Chr04g0142441 [Helianthus annuus]